MQEELRRELSRLRDLTARLPSSALQNPSAELAHLTRSLSKLADTSGLSQDFPDGVSVYSVIAAWVFDLEVLGKSDGVRGLLAQYRQSASRAH